jgi:hypothetical protein
MTIKYSYILLFVCLFLFGKASLLNEAYAGEVPTDFKFQMPVDCEYGKDCWLVHTVNHGTSTAEADSYCRARTYGAHRGTDFGVKDMDDIRAGVDILAAQKGRILRTIDQYDDYADLEFNPNAVAYNCGNEVFIDHGNGWQTQYCHLKKGSVKVRGGQRVEQGEVIAQMGSSGNSKSPHLHLNIFYKGQYVDPFTATVKGTKCNPFKNKTLWMSTDKYPAPYYTNALQIFNWGATKGDLSMSMIKEGLNHKDIEIDEDDYVKIWLAGYFLQSGDLWQIDIYNDKKQKLYSKTGTVKNDSDMGYYYFTYGFPRNGTDVNEYYLVMRTYRIKEGEKRKMDEKIGKLVVRYE